MDALKEASIKRIEQLPDGASIETWGKYFSKEN